MSFDILSKLGGSARQLDLLKIVNLIQINYRHFHCFATKRATLICLLQPLHVCNNYSVSSSKNFTGLIPIEISVESLV